MSYPQHLSGQAAEDFACDYLLKQGLKLLQRNYFCRLGEIDLIMNDSTNCVFIEVRYRKNRHYGGALESVTHTKQQRLIRAASHFLQTRPEYADLPCRFDVIAVGGDPDKYSANWIRNAFMVNA
jgi:putative endonuclease